MSNNQIKILEDNIKFLNKLIISKNFIIEEKEKIIQKHLETIAELTNKINIALALVESVNKELKAATSLYKIQEDFMLNKMYKFELDKHIIKAISIKNKYRQN